MCEGEFESLKAIHAVSPGFVPEPYAWGKYAQEDPETYFLLAEFRNVGRQVCTFRDLRCLEIHMAIRVFNSSSRTVLLVAP